MQNLRSFLAVNSPGGVAIEAVLEVASKNPLAKMCYRIKGGGRVTKPCKSTLSVKELADQINESLASKGFLFFCKQQNVMMKLESIRPVALESDFDVTFTFQYGKGDPK